MKRINVQQRNAHIVQMQVALLVRVMRGRNYRVKRATSVAERSGLAMPALSRAVCRALLKCFGPVAFPIGFGISRPRNSRALIGPGLQQRGTGA